MKNKKISYQSQLGEYEQQMIELKNKLEKVIGNRKKDFKYSFTSFIRDIDIQQYTSRYKWVGLPPYLPPNIIERLLYIKGSICGFFRNGVLYFMPYAFNGKLNPYGYPTRIKPIALNGESFGNMYLDTYANGELNKKADAVILTDRPTWQTNDVAIPRLSLQSDIIDLMSDTLVKSYINLKNSARKGIVQVDSEDQVKNVREDINTANDAEDPYIVISRGGLDGNNGDVWNSGIDINMEEYIQYLSSLNNLRCYGLGLKNQGIYEKNERMITGELSGVDYQTALILYSGLEFRKDFIERLKEIYPEYRDVLGKINVKINLDAYNIEELRREEGK